MIQAEPGTIDWVLTTTRAVRRRLDLERPVDLELVRECLALALQAPTGADLQGWRWLVLTDPVVKSRLQELYLEAMQQPTTGARKAPTPQSERMGKDARDLANHLAQVPVLVIACIRGGLTPNSSPHQIAALTASIYPAVWSLQLALRSRGLVSALTTVHLEKREAVAELLGIPDGITQAALIPIAHLVGSSDLHPANRKPVQEVAFLNHWGERWEEKSAE